MITTWIIIAIVSLVFSALFSGTEMAYVSSDRVRVQLDVKRGGIISRIIDLFYGNSELFISTILVGNNIVLVIYGMGAAALLQPLLEGYIHNEALMLIAQTLISTGVILLAGEFLPKSIMRINPNKSMKLLAVPIYLLYIVLYPISLFTTALSRLLMRVMGIKTENPRLHFITVGDLNDYLEETIDNMEEKQTTVENEVKIFQNALDFSSTHLRDCMTPRNEIVAVNIDTVTREELSDLFTKTGRSKIIVFKEDIDTILGYIHVSELFDPATDWHDHVKPVLFAPENLLANKMMRRLLQQKRSMAIVVDEFGGTAGLITLEDLVEEIFGDIQDEHDKSGLTAHEVAPGIYEFSGRCEIAEINETYHLDIPEDDSYQTLAGYILHTTGTIPAQGELITLGRLRYEIVKKSATRLELIRVAAATLDAPAGE